MIWETDELGEVPFLPVDISDPDIFHPEKSFNPVLSYNIGKNIDDLSLPNAFDILESNNNNAMHRLDRPGLEFNAANPIKDVLRTLLSFDFEALDVNQINITVEATDTFKLSDKASFTESWILTIHLSLYHLNPTIIKSLKIRTE